MVFSKRPRPTYDLLQPIDVENIRVWEIAEKRKRNSFNIATADDFALHGSTPVDNLDSFAGRTFYCIDIRTKLALYTIADDLDAVLTAPFLYQKQHDTARAVVTVPFDQLGMVDDQEGLTPTFILSIGRCGSTLVSRLLNGVGKPSVSEPDAPTQLAVLSRKNHTALDTGTAQSVVHACVASLASHCGKSVFIKLRSQCNAIAPLLLHALPNARYVFVLRAAVPWMRSMHRSFGFKPAGLAHALREGIEAYDALANSASRSALVWYEDLLSQPEEVLRTVSGSGDTWSHDQRRALSNIMTTDSQAGSEVSRGRLAHKVLPEELAPSFQKEWRKIRPTELIARHNLDRIDD